MRKIVVLLGWLAASVTMMFAQSGRSAEILFVDNANYYLHRVEAGESVADIAALYSLSDGEIVEVNGLDPVAPAIAEGDVLRVPCYERISRLQPKRGDKRYERHRPERGESLFEVAVEYAIALDTLIADNPGLDITNLHGKTSLFVRRSAMKGCQVADIVAQSRRYVELLTGLSEEYDYFTVEQGETLYSLAIRHQVDLEELSEENGNPTIIYEGMALKCRREKKGFVDEQSGSAIRSNIVAYLDSLANDRVEFRPFEDEVLTVSLMLPLSDTLGRVRGSFVEFYQGALLAAEDMKMEGRSLELQLFNTKNSASRVAEIVDQEVEMMDATDLFIGPIYERNAADVLEYAAEMGVPVVSPLATTTKGSYGRNYYRLAPTERTKGERLNGMVAPETNVIMIYTASNDEELERDVLEVLGDHPYGKVIYNEFFELDSLQSSPIEELMAEDDNLFVVLSDNEIDADRSLAIISSMMNSRQPRYGMRRVPIRVIGSADWAKYKNMDKNLLFKLDVSYVAPYHADRGSRRIREFDRRFIKTFGRAPSMFAYRAYDAMMLFANAIYAGGDLTAELNGSVVPLLQTRYSFSEEDGNMVNDLWMVVNYRPNYTIEVR